VLPADSQSTVTFIAKWDGAVTASGASHEQHAVWIDGETPLFEIDSLEAFRPGGK
jgi:hypothetical protein